MLQGEQARQAGAAAGEREAAAASRVGELAQALAGARGALEAQVGFQRLK